MKVLVTGAGGFIGRYVVEELRGLGHPVRATDLPGADLSPSEAAGAEIMPGDLLNRDETRAMLDGVTHVVHSAAAFNLALPLEACLRVNRDATLLLAEEAGKRRVSQFLHISTGGVYGESVFTPMREDHPHHACDSYSVSKEAGECAVTHRMRDYGIPFTIFRPTAVYGPHSTYVAGAFYVVPSIMRQKGIRKIPSFSGGKSLNFVHVKDIAGAIGFCVDNPDAFNQDFNLAEDKPLVAGEFFDLLLGLFGFEITRRVPYPTRFVERFARLALKIPYSLSFGPATRVLGGMWRDIVAEQGLVPKLKPALDKDFLYFLLGNHYLDNSKIRGIGYVSRYPTCVEGLGETIEWYRRERWLP